MSSNKKCKACGSALFRHYLENRKIGNFCDFTCVNKWKAEKAKESKEKRELK